MKLTKLSRVNDSLRIMKLVIRKESFYRSILL